ncbi:hypothetical protein GCM10027402_32890 [Arthrobacter monumenti]
MHIVTGILIALVGVTLIFISGSLARFQARTFHEFGIAVRTADRFVPALMWGSRVFGVLLIALGLFIAITGYL